jgi:transcriptional regulator with XRE-family HTH domain
MTKPSALPATSASETIPTLGESLRALRAAKSVSLRAVAAEVDCSVKHLWTLENDSVQRPNGALLARLADYYLVSLDEIFGRKTSSHGSVPRQLAECWHKLDSETRSDLLALISKLARDR